MNKKGGALGMIYVIAKSPLAWVAVITPIIFFTFVGSLISWSYTIGIILLVMSGLLLLLNRIKPIHAVVPVVVALLFIVNPGDFLSFGFSFNSMSVGSVVEGDTVSVKVAMIALIVALLQLMVTWRRK